MSSDDTTQPALRIVSGDPSPEELAAVTVVLTLLGRAGEPPAESEPSAWSDLSLRLRRPLPPGPGAWRNSAWI